MRSNTTTSRLQMSRSGCLYRSQWQDGHANREHNGRRCRSVQPPVPAIPGCKRRGLHLPSALREPGNCCARLRPAVQRAARRDGLKMDAVLQTERTIYSLRHTAICMRIILSQGRSTSSTSPRMPAPASIRSNASSPQPAALARAGEEPAELWGVINAKQNWSMRETMSASGP